MLPSDKRGGRSHQIDFPATAFGQEGARGG